MENNVVESREIIIKYLFRLGSIDCKETTNRFDGVGGIFYQN